MNASAYHKYVIVGAGPGGLQMGYFLDKASRDYVILERENTAGSFFKDQPRHRKLLSINKKYNFFEEPEFNWRHDWNSLLSDDPSLRFTNYTDELFPDADLLYRYLQDYSAALKLNVRYGCNVTKIAKQADGRFVLSLSENEQVTCDVLLLGLGAVREDVPTDIEGIDLATSYNDHDITRAAYRNKRVGIIGQGNSAFETAEHLAGVASYVHVFVRNSVRFAWETHFVGDLRAVNNNLLDMYQLKSMHAVLKPRLRGIRRLENGALQTRHEYDYPSSSVPGTLHLTREYDCIIRCTGWKWVNDAIFDERTRPETWKDGKYPKLTPEWESKNVANLYFVGGAMQGNDRQAASGFIHGFRYNIRTLFHILMERFEAVPYPQKVMAPFAWNEFLSWMYDRVSLSASLFQLYGVLCDVVVISKDRKRAVIYQDLPKSAAVANDYGDSDVLMLTLEFGFHKFGESSITFMGPSDPNDTTCAAFLHPVVRHRRNGEMTEFHFGDSLLGRWDRPHQSGGAVTSYHYHFQQWVEQRLEMDLDLPDPIPNRAYRAWSPEEIAGRAAASQASAQMGHRVCRRP